MLASSAQYRSTLHGPHRRVAFVDSFDIFGNVLERDVPVSSGSVSALLTNRVTRTARFDLADEWWPGADPAAPFSPYTAVVSIRAGIGYGDGSYDVFPVFKGRVYDARRGANGTVQVRADDLAADVVGFKFEQPQTSSRSRQATLLTEWKRLILEALPEAQFGQSTVLDSPCPPLVWDEDRGQALDDLAEAAGGRWFALGDGSFVMRPFSYEPGPVVAEILDGPGGLMSTADVSITRDGAANSVTVVSERLDGSAPVRSIQRDIDLASPTRFGGPYGRVSQVIKVQTPLSQSQARLLARTQLGAAVALSEQWTARVVPDYTLEPADTTLLRYRGYSAHQVIDGITYPLGTSDDMTLATRGAIPVTVSGA